MVALNNSERNHIFQVVSLFLKDFFSNIILAIIALKFLYSEFGLTMSLLILFLFILLFLFFAFAKWYKTSFYLKGDSIYYQTGIFNIKKRELHFDKVCTVDISQKLLDKLFGLARIKIDTGTNKNGKSEISLLLKMDRTIQIKKLILRTEFENTEIQELSEYRISNGELIKYSLVSDALFSGIAIIFVIYNFFDDIFREILNVEIFDNISWSSSNILLSVITIIIFVLFLSVVLSIINSFIKYYNFRVYLNNSKLNINYGLLNKKNYSFEINKIKGIHVKQNLLMQLLNIRSLEIESLGYGDEQGETAILYPICNKNYQDEILSSLLPEFAYTGTIEKAPKKALSRFIIKKVFFTLILIGITTYFVPYGLISIILLPFVIGIGCLEYKNSAIGFHDSILYMSYNSFFKRQSIIKTKDIQSFVISHTYFQKRKKLCNYAVFIYSNQFGKKIKVKNLNKTDIFNDFYSII